MRKYLTIRNKEVHLGLLITLTVISMVATVYALTSYVILRLVAPVLAFRHEVVYEATVSTVHCWLLFLCKWVMACKVCLFVMWIFGS